ncbi:hypothetical protein [Rubinisphaera margarita]|uniref:hypothetical protein n=1 Tax=Rubinisphaera margarita TaxID=2909586 RepID=UPI001EE881EA|nr:hypothetical protein [Rubinisphaera margarita]MCG6154208.1 hypothetical protein [Rubinisphaera margarita]
MIIKAQPDGQIARALRSHKGLKLLKMTQSGVYCLADEETYRALTGGSSNGKGSTSDQPANATEQQDPQQPT